MSKNPMIFKFGGFRYYYDHRVMAIKPLDDTVLNPGTTVVSLCNVVDVPGKRPLPVRGCSSAALQMYGITNRDIYIITVSDEVSCIDRSKHSAIYEHFDGEFTTYYGYVPMDECRLRAFSRSINTHHLSCLLLPVADRSKY